MGEAKAASNLRAVFGLAVGLIVAAALIDDATIAWLLTPLILVLLGYAASLAPLRNSLAVLMFCALTLDYPTEALAAGLVKSPFYYVGFALLNHLNNLTGIREMSFSGTDVMLAILITIAVSRERSGAKIDRMNRLPTPPQLVQLAKLSLGGMLFVWMYGLVTGGDFGKSLWQAERVFYLPVFVLLYHLALRGPQDHKLLAKVVLTAASIRALTAIYISQTVFPPPHPITGVVEPLPYATSHSDSMLFATAFVLMVLMVVERAGPKVWKHAALFLPLFLLGMVANNRRMVWVHVGMILATLYTVAPDNLIKRRIRQTAYRLVPIIAGYAAVGWNSGTPLFKPVRIMRSVIEPSTDGSSLWRELENYNLIFTLKDYPLLGQGYGHRWKEIVLMPAVDYDLEYYLPHNSLLGLWAAGGFVGYTAITLLWGAGVYYAMRSYHAAKAPQDRVAAILCVGAVMVYMVQCFGDLGLGSWTGVHILAPSIAAAGKLAVATGSLNPPLAAPPAPSQAEPV